MATLNMELRGPAGRAFRLLHVGFALLPIIAGVDKFTNWLVDWDRYLAPSIALLFPVDVGVQMRIGGIIEIAAGVLVWRAPRLGGMVVAAWLWAIIGNLMLLGGSYDIALRDAGLSLGALALSQLAVPTRLRAIPPAGSADVPVKTTLREEELVHGHAGM